MKVIFDVPAERFDEAVSCLRQFTSQLSPDHKTCVYVCVCGEEERLYDVSRSNSGTIKVRQAWRVT